ncbi:hypothetical protein [Polymorphobacter arshaanensis]|uniref:hypothetical protein n=1 Tax=Glacieibacterium arshaanense TaxID=2511025 RepID=UPI0014073E87|nr:hypothetical protein [Polymorphobacter arshaanensis]
MFKIFDARFAIFTFLLVPMIVLGLVDPTKFYWIIGILSACVVVASGGLAFAWYRSRY